MLESILMLSEFSEVFLIDLPGLPINRDIDFYTALNTFPFFHHMALTKLKDLKEQLQLSKGFIRPSVSPYGAPY